MRDEISKSASSLPGPGLGQATPREHPLEPGSWPIWRCGRRGVTSLLLTPDKRQKNLQRVLAQAFSSVIIKLKIMIYA